METKTFTKTATNFLRLLLLHFKVKLCILTSTVESLATEFSNIVLMYTTTPILSFGKSALQGFFLLNFKATKEDFQA